MSYLNFSALTDMAAKSSGVTQACACNGIDLSGWTSVPLSFDTSLLETVGTLVEDPFVEQTFVEYHPAGTRYDDPAAPIAPRYYPANRCEVARCKRCGRYYLRYTEAGGYFTDARIRSLRPELLVDATLVD